MSKRPYRCDSDSPRARAVTVPLPVALPVAVPVSPTRTPRRLRLPVPVPVVQVTLAAGALGSSLAGPRTGRHWHLHCQPASDSGSVEAAERSALCTRSCHTHTQARVSDIPR